MNRRAFLSALGAVATQQKLRRKPFENDEIDGFIPPPTITTSRYPYVQNVSNDRASILWATFEAGFGYVRYSSDGLNFNFAPATTRFFSRSETGLLANYVQYQADLTGLRPNTDYVYAVDVDGQEIGSTGQMRFRTAGPGPFSFIVLGDSGWGDPRSNAQGLIAQRIAAEQPALVIHTGDLVYPVGSFEYYQRNYFNYYSTIMATVPFFPCPGNHDYDMPNASPYVAVHSVPTNGVPAPDRGRYYSYDWGNAHFVSIDAHHCLERAVNGNGPMLRWLENDLRSTRQFWRIVYFHYPPYATGQNVNDPQSMWARQHVVPILENHGVQLVFSGHEHSYQRSLPIRKSNFVAPGTGTNYITSGGGGAILYAVPDKPMIAFARSMYHYLTADVQGTRITIRSILQDGVELERFSIAPVPVFSDDPRVVPVTMTPGPVAGAHIRIIGRALAAEENFSCTPTPPEAIAGTVVTVNGRPIQLLYVSPNQIYGQMPFTVDGNVTIRVTTANGFTERSL
jgi:predicted MPP superfamily phosphohydrolase